MIDKLIHLSPTLRGWSGYAHLVIDPDGRTPLPRPWLDRAALGDRH